MEEPTMHIYYTRDEQCMCQPWQQFSVNPSCSGRSEYVPIEETMLFIPEP